MVILFLLLGMHLYLTIHLGFVQKKIPSGIRHSLFCTEEGAKKDGISSYSALAMALAATIGTGNIVGVSAAIAIGGPGAIFWCWITGVLGIATCYAECYLSVLYKQKNADGESFGGPMYVLEYGLGKKHLAVIFSLCAVFASFGIGSSVQAHSIYTAAERLCDASPAVVGAVICGLAGIIFIGGNRFIAGVCNWLVPIMSFLYLGGCILIIWKNRMVLPETFETIFNAAFTGRAAAGGVAGQGMLLGIRTGIARGLFTNEAGLGSIPMAAAASGEKSPKRQGMISMTGPFWDTVVMCALTGIAIVGSMIAAPGKFVGMDAEQLCFLAFAQIPGGTFTLSVALILFAFATIIGWNVYGTSAVRYLWGERMVGKYQVIYLVFAYLGAVMNMKLVWGMADVWNCLMALPNLYAIWRLRKRIEKP